MNYTQIKAGIQSWLHDTSAETVALLDTFIQVGEARLNREFRSPRLIDSTTGTIASTVSLPTDFQELVSLCRVDSANYTTAIPQLSIAGIRKGHSGYAITSSGLVFSPDLSGTYQLDYYPKLDSIITSTSNYVSETHPDLYLYACSLEAATFLRDDKEADFRAGYNAYLDQANTAENRYAQTPQMKADFYVP